MSLSLNLVALSVLRVLAVLCVFAVVPCLVVTARCNNGEKRYLQNTSDVGLCYMSVYILSTQDLCNLKMTPDQTARMHYENTPIQIY